MPASQELRSYYKRMLFMFKEVEAENSSPLLRRHILAIETEMDAEDVAYVNEKLKQG